MVAPVISSLPVAPQRTDLPATFSDRADAFVAALQPFRNQLNDALAWQNLTFEATDQALNQANQARDEAQSAADDAEQSNQESQAAKDLSQQWAESDDPVEGGRSSKYWKEQAEVVAAAVQSAAGLPSLVGNGLNVLTVNADEQTVEWLPGVQSLYSEFTESGTFTPDPRARWVYVRLIGAGASGGASVATSINSDRAGGEGGHVIEALYRAQDLSAAVTVTVGAGGAPVVSSGVNLGGNDGGDTTFGNLLTALGGVSSGSTHRSTRMGEVFPCTGGAGGGTQVSNGVPAGPGGAGLGGGGGGGSGHQLGGASLRDGGRGGDGALLPSSGSADDGEWPGGGGGGVRVSASAGGETATSGAGADGVARIWQW